MSEKLKNIKSNEISVENQKGIKNHKIIISHLHEAIKHHEEAVEHHKAEDHKKAALSTIIAQGHIRLAIDAQHEDLKHHALIFYLNI